MAAEYSEAANPVSGTHYLTADHLGSTRLVTDEAGSAVNTYNYFPFGEEIGGGDELNPKFTGKLRDYESGLNLDYFGARYYAGAMGRFTSADAPFADQQPADPQSWNLYVYVRNNPLVYTDPTGRCMRPGASVSSCFNYFVGGAKALANIPSDAGTMLNRGLNRLTGSNIPDAPRFEPTNHDQREGMKAAQIMMTVSPAAELAAAKAAATGATVPLVTRNAAQGKAFQNTVAAETALTDANVVQNITVRTQSGVRTQIDVVSTTARGNIALKEAKPSATAGLTRNQAAAHPEIAETGATVVGKGKSPYTGGTELPPTRVEVVRPRCPGGAGCPD